MKINIFYNFKDGPWGGGNQFLKALRKYLEATGLYEDNPQNSDAILINGFIEKLSDLFFLLETKKKFPEKIIILRLDGPISLIRGKDKEIDEMLRKLNLIFFDGIIYQSKWSKEKNKNIFSFNSRYETIIYNAPDPTVFYPKMNNSTSDRKEKTRIISTSWSSNMRKGFKVYEFLDTNLDFNKFSMTFVGNSPIQFKNIKSIPPLNSRDLAEKLRSHDIFITASQNDPCSNSLIEALACGLPAIGLDDGGHPELIQNGGELFNSQKEVIKKINMVTGNIHNYMEKLPKFDIADSQEKYTSFIKEIVNDAHENKYSPKKITTKTKMIFYQTVCNFIFWRIKDMFSNVIKQS